MSDLAITQTVNRHKNMILIGSAKTNYMINKITYFDSYESVLSNYGESKLTSAFKIAKDFGVPNIFLINVKYFYDLFEIVSMLKQNDFTYIVPVDLMMSDYYNDPYRNNQKISYCQYLLEEIGDYNNSTIVVSDKHASLYEDIDAFLTEMMSLCKTFNKTASINIQRQNLVFVANNLVNHNMANVALASAMCVCDINEYPQLNFGSAIFDIDSFDVSTELSFFKNNILTATSVENLLNFNHIVKPEKIVTIDRIIKYIKREIDFSEFTGKQFTGYQKVRITKKLTTFLQSLKGYVINDFYIESIVPYRNTPGTITVLSRFDIWPINCIEKCSIGIEVDV